MGNIQHVHHHCHRRLSTANQLKISSSKTYWNTLRKLVIYDNMLSHSILPIGGQQSISGAPFSPQPISCVQYLWTCRNFRLCYIVPPVSGSDKSVTNHEACAARQSYRHSGLHRAGGHLVRVSWHRIVGNCREAHSFPRARRHRVPVSWLPHVGKLRWSMT
jgi:hypothetical protein